MLDTSSIGHHFFALSPKAQADRIEEFFTAIHWRNPDFSPVSLAKALRRALSSMNRFGPLPRIRAVGGTVEICGEGYQIVFRGNTAVRTYEEDTTP